jgi:hypothetical protein
MLIDTAREQVSRLDPGSLEAGRMLHGEALIITGVLDAIMRLVSVAWNKMEGLAERHSAAISDIAALRAQLTQIPDRRHIVAPAHRGKPHQLESAEEPSKASRYVGGFISRMRSPRVVPADAVFGDAVTTTQAGAEHAELGARIAADDAEGETRHHHHVARIWQWAARAVLFFDVVALSTLTIKLENMSLDPAIWQQQFPEQLQKLLVAVCFALFGATVVAVLSHHVGAETWRYIHRTSPLLDARGHGKRYLIAGWAVLAALSLLMGAAILTRLQHEAAGSHTSGSVAVCVALVIGLSGVLAPLAVALVEAMHSSPEVLRRTALARIVQAANHDEQALGRQIGGQQAEMVELVAAGERLLADILRRVDAERLPAHQAILMLRTSHGYAGEYAAVIRYPEPDTGFLADLDHWRQLKPLAELLNRMRSSTPALPDSAEDSQPDEAESAESDTSAARTDGVIHNGVPLSTQ